MFKYTVKVKTAHVVPGRAKEGVKMQDCFFIERRIFLQLESPCGLENTWTKREAARRTRLLEVLIVVTIIEDQYTDCG